MNLPINKPGWQQSRFYLAIFILFLCLSGRVHSATNTLASFDWEPYSTILKNYIKSGKKFGIESILVDYKSLAKSLELESIASALDAYDPGKLSRTEKIAFYLNAYNFYTIKLICSEEPKHSIRDIGSPFSPVWKKEVGRINGKAITLDYVEHEILRSLGDPRIHFALVCASLSCPDLRGEAYTATNLDKQLEEQTTRFLSNRTKGMIVEDGQLKLSKIFYWFEEDFDSSGGVLAFAQRYQPGLNKYNDYSYFSYDWRLNEE